MEDPEAALLVARYVIESNDEENLIFDENTTNDIQVVESILKKMIGPLPNWDTEASNRLNEEVCLVLMYC